MIGWLDCRAGASGDMLLGALVDVGVPLEVLQQAVDGLGVEPIRLQTEAVTRGGLGATLVHVETVESVATRTWSDVRRILDDAALAAPVLQTAQAVFGRLAAAEAAVHRVPPDEVHFHEVGALDALADIVGTAAGLHALGLTSLAASTVSLGAGGTRGAHGPLPVPAPAVLALLAGRPVAAGPAPYELTTPTGAALLATVVHAWGELPAMTVTRVGMGAGSRDPKEVANVLRLVVGEELAPPGEDQAILLESNVDDLDPRVWPAVLARLLAVGVNDAWLTPILMKKGRPAHTLSVLCTDATAIAARAVIFTETSTIGLREQRVTKRALERVGSTVSVQGKLIRVKTARYEGRDVNVNPEYDDVLAAAVALDWPVKTVLQAAQAQATRSRTTQTRTTPAQTTPAQTAKKNATTPPPSASGTATTS